jgi:hypothetical protein
MEGGVLLQLEFWLNLDEQWADAERAGLRKLAAQVRLALQAAALLAASCESQIASEGAVPFAVCMGELWFVLLEAR